MLGMYEKDGRAHEKIICPKSFHKIRETEAVTGGFCRKRCSLNFFQNSQGNTCARVSFLINLLASACNFIKKETLA